MGNGHIEAVRQYALTFGKAPAPEEAKAFTTTSVCDTKQGVSGPAPEWRGVPQSFGTSGDGCGTGLEAQRQRAMENVGSECNFDKELATGL